MGWMLEALGLPNDKESRGRLDAALRQVLGKQEAHCPEIWTAIKEVSEPSRVGLIAEVSERLASE